MRSVVRGRPRPAQMLAITFTDKAAGELRARVRARLLELGQREAARDTEAAWVSTFHGFCARVLRAHAVGAGLDPAFAVLDEAGARALRRDGFDAALAGLLADRDGAPRLDALDLAAAYTPDRLAEMVTSVHDALRSRGQTRPALPAVAPPVLSGARADLERAARAAAAELARCPRAEEHRPGACGDRSLPGDARGARIGRAGDRAGIGGGVLQARVGGRAAGRAVRALPAGPRGLRRRLPRRAGAAGARAPRRAAGSLRRRVRGGQARALRRRLRRPRAARARPPRRRRRPRRRPTRSGSSGSWSTSSRTRTRSSSRSSASWTATTSSPSATSCSRSTGSATPTWRSSAVAVPRSRRATRRPRWPRASAPGRRSWPRSTRRSPTFTATRWVPLRPGRDDPPDDDPRVELLVTDAGAWNGDAPAELGDGLPPGPSARHAEARLVAQRIARLVRRRGRGGRRDRRAAAGGDRHGAVRARARARGPEHARLGRTRLVGAPPGLRTCAATSARWPTRATRSPCSGCWPRRSSGSRRTRSRCWPCPRGRREARSGTRCTTRSVDAARRRPRAAGGVPRMVRRRARAGAAPRAWTSCCGAW